MASPLALRLRIFREETRVEPSKNPWVRFYFLASLKPQPCRFRIGDVCKVKDPKHERFGQVGRVIYASGETVELMINSHSFYAKPNELQWMGHTKIG